MCRAFGVHFFGPPCIITFVVHHLAPFRRYGGLKVENRQFVPTPPLFNTLARGDPLRISGSYHSDISKN